jgi:hypothetical protein
MSTTLPPENLGEWMRLVERRLSLQERREEPNAFTTDDSDWLSDDISYGAGWVDGGGLYRIIDSIVYLRGFAQRTGADLTASSTGHLVNNTMFTLPAAAVPPMSFTGHWTTDGGSGTFAVLPTGEVQVLDAGPNQTISTGDTVRAYLVYPFN